MADQMLPLHLFTLGAPEVRLGENLVTFPTRKTLALLIYLAIEAGAAAARAPGCPAVAGSKPRAQPRQPAQHARPPANGPAPGKRPGPNPLSFRHTQCAGAESRRRHRP